jgi:large subunit ribosomal protein L29
MKIEKLRESDTSELSSQQREIQEQMFRLRFQMSMGQTDGLKKLRELKKDRARILTLLREREAPAEASQPAAAKPAGKSKASAAPKKAAAGKKASPKGKQ